MNWIKYTSLLSMYRQRGPEVSKEMNCYASITCLGDCKIPNKKEREERKIEQTMEKEERKNLYIIQPGNDLQWNFPKYVSVL